MDNGNVGNPYIQEDVSLHHTLAVFSLEVAAGVSRVSGGHGAHVLQEAVGLVTLVTRLMDILTIVTILRPSLSFTFWNSGVRARNILSQEAHEILSYLFH